MKNTGKLLLAIVLLLAAAQAWGGVTQGGDPNANGPGDSSDGCGCGSSKGMPVYSFKSMLASLSIRDTPISYTPPAGPKMDTTIYYNQREADQPATFDAFNLGRKWTMNWLTYIQDSPTAPGSQVLRYVAGGGGRPYSGYNAATGKFKPEQDNGALLVMTSSNPITYELRFANGSKDVFAESDGKTTYPRKVFLTRIVDPKGNTVILHYDSQLRLISVTDAIGQATTFQYNDTANPLLVTGITDPFGRHATLGYDSHGRLDSITDEIGMTSTFAYDSGTFIDSMTTPYGTTRFAHTEGANGDSTELSIQATDPLGHTERTEYLPAAPGVPYSVSKVPTGMSTDNAYLNYRDSYYWDKDAYAAACSDSTGITICDYTKARLKHFFHLYPCCDLTSRVLESVKYPLEGMIWYDHAGQPSAIFPGTLDKPSHIGRVLDDGSTQLTSYAYNAFGKVTQKIDPDGRETDYTYAHNGIDLIKVQQRNGGSFDTLAQYTYNSQHEPLTHTDATGQATTYTYNTRGQRTSATDALGNTTRYAYDSKGYLTTITSALGRTQHRFTYDAEGRIASDTDSRSYTRRYTYDALNRITRIKYPDNTSRIFAWNKLDLAAVTDRQGNTTTYTYDADRNLIAVTNPMGHSTKYGYYPKGKLHTLTDPNGNVTTWTRDLEGRVIAKTYANGHGDTLAYDNSSRLSSVTDALGQTKHYRYDPDDLPIGISYQNAVNPTANVSYTYDPYYPRLVSMTDGIGTTTFNYVPVGTAGALKLASTQGPFSTNDTVTNTYDALDRVIERSTDQKDAFSYDALGRKINETNPLGSFGYRYLGDTDQPRKQTLTTPWNTAGYSLDISYDGNTRDRQLRSLTYRRPFGFLPTESLSFKHSPAHLLRSRFEFSLAPLHTHLNTYRYDKAHRLTKTKLDRFLPADRYVYDAAGNLIHSQSNTGARLNATANELNQLATVNGTAWQYDADGNLINDGTFEYAWDAANRLVAVTKLATGHITSFKYDGLGRRLAIDEQNSGATPTETRYLWCGNTLCGARDGNNHVTADYYTQGEMRNGTALYYVKDQVGTVMDVINARGRLLGAAEYSPYGVTKLSAGTTADFGYAGMLYNQATGLYLTKYREYNPAVGRWLNRDPIGALGGTNVYAYVGGNPVSRTDPNGEFGVLAALSTGAAIGGTAAFTGTLYETGSFKKAVNAVPGGVLGGVAAVGLAGAEVPTFAGAVAGVIADLGINAGLDVIDIADVLSPKPSSNDAGKSPSCPR